MTAEFTRSARKPAQIIEGALLQWATGLTTRARTIYAGWLIEAGKLNDLDQALADAGYQYVEIKHGSGNIVTHWAIETANLFLVADGVQSIGEMKHTTQRYGIAFGWRTLEGGRQQSQLKARVILRQLAMLDYYEPITLTAKSTTTGDVIAALMRQYDVLEAVDAFRALDGKGKLAAPLYAASLEIGPGAEVARGSGATTKEITPPVASIPTPITKEYVKQHWTWGALTKAIEPLVDDTVAWSIAESARIAGAAEHPRNDDWEREYDRMEQAAK